MAKAVEAPEVDVPEFVVEAKAVETPAAEDKPATQNATGKFEKLLHEGKYYLVNVDGRVLSSGDTEDAVDRMVMSLNNKRR